MTSAGVSCRLSSRWGVEPDAHRVIERAEQARLADPGCAGQYVEHIDDRVVGNKQRILLAALAVEHDELQDCRRFLLDRQPLQLDFLRKLGQGGLHPVLTALVLMSGSLPSTKLTVRL